MSKSAWNTTDLHMMKLAFKEAHEVYGTTLPNPAVGAVLARGGKVIAKGGTSVAGGPHAEIVALRKAGTKARGAILYVTLEPCCHQGRTPPCVLSLIEARIKKVFISMKDPNKAVMGKGINMLKRAGIQVRLGLMQEEANEFYKSYRFFALHNRPRIILKIAQSADGSINAGPGQRTAITGREAQMWTHNLRNRVDAVVIGANTLRVDNPDLSPRLAKPGRKHLPDAVVLTRKGKLPLSHWLFQVNPKRKCVVISPKAVKLPEWIDSHQGKAKILEIRDITQILRQRGYHSVLVEGGAEILSQWLGSGLWDVFYILISAKVLPQGLKWSQGLPHNWQESLEIGRFCQIGKDMILTMFPQNTSRK